MCGRFAQHASLNKLIEQMNIKDVTCSVSPRYNIAPFQDILAVVKHPEKKTNRLGRLRWGFVPSWAENAARGAINARKETVAEKPYFREAFRKRRCLIPADGFYEWKTIENRRQPWYFCRSDGNPFAFAGLWEKWEGGGKTIYTCVILTQNASDSVSDIHSRMPVILEPHGYDRWLDPENTNKDDINALLEHHVVSSLKRYPVSMMVNSGKIDKPGCIEAI